MIKAIVAARDLGSNLAQNKKPIIFLVISGVTNSPGAVSSFFSISMAPVVIVILTAGARTGELKLFSMSILYRIPLMNSEPLSESNPFQSNEALSPFFYKTLLSRD